MVLSLKVSIFTQYSLLSESILMGDNTLWFPWEVIFWQKIFFSSIFREKGNFYDYLLKMKSENSG